MDEIRQRIAELWKNKQRKMDWLGLEGQCGEVYTTNIPLTVCEVCCGNVTKA